MAAAHRGSGQLICRASARALGDKTNLILASGCMTAALVVGVWWLLLLGLLACVGFTLWKLTRPGVLGSLLNDAAKLQLAEQEDLREPELQTLANRFIAGRSEVKESLSRTPVEIRASLGPLLEWLDELEAWAVRGVLRAQELSDWLRLIQQTTLDVELQQLGELADHTTALEPRREYERVRALQAERLQAMNEVVRARDRTVAGLLRATAVVKGLPARLVSLRLLDSQLKEDLSMDLSDVLDHLQAELQSAEQTLRSVTTLPAGSSL